MLNEMNVKNPWDSVRCKYQRKQRIKTREENVATNENCFLRKMGLKFQNPSFNTLFKIAFWKKQKRLNKELIIWNGVACLMEQPCKMINSIWKKIFDRLEPIQPAFTMLGQLASPFP